MSTSFFCSTSVQYPFLFEISWQIFSTLFKKDLLRIPISNIYPSHLSFKPSSSYREINVFLLLQCIHRPPLSFFLIVESMLVSFFSNISIFHLVFFSSLSLNCLLLIFWLTNGFLLSSLYLEWFFFTFTWHCCHYLCSGGNILAIDVDVHVDVDVGVI